MAMVSKIIKQRKSQVRIRKPTSPSSFLGLSRVFRLGSSSSCFPVEMSARAFPVVSLLPRGETPKGGDWCLSGFPATDPSWSWFFLWLQEFDLHFFRIRPALAEIFRRNSCSEEFRTGIVKSRALAKIYQEFIDDVVPFWEFYFSKSSDLQHPHHVIGTCFDLPPQHLLLHLERRCSSPLTQPDVVYKSPVGSFLHPGSGLAWSLEASFSSPPGNPSRPKHGLHLFFLHLLGVSINFVFSDTALIVMNFFRAIHKGEIIPPDGPLRKTLIPQAWWLFSKDWNDKIKVHLLCLRAKLTWAGPVGLTFLVDF